MHALGGCIFLFLLGISLLGCTRAGSVVDNRLTAPERFEISVPEPGRWRLVRNVRTAQKTEVCYRKRQSRATQCVRVWTPTAEEQELPLDVLAFSRLLGRLGADGVVELLSMNRILLDDREGVAVTARQLIRPVETRAAAVVLRSQGYGLELELLASASEFDDLAGDFEALMRHFTVRLPGHFDPMRLEDLPANTPGGMPPLERSWTRKSPPAVIPRDLQLPVD